MADCFAIGGGRLLRIDEALAELEGRLACVAGVEEVPLAEGLGRILAADRRSTVMVPPFDNSAMDGWAVAAADLPADLPGGSGGFRLPVGGRIAAGHPLAEPARPGHAYRIFTGAPLPPGLDTVAMQEDCREENGAVLLPAGLKPGANRRPAGEAVAVGDVPLTAGTRLQPQHLGVAATLGLTRLPVRRPLRVAVFSTGDELREPGAPLPFGCIHDANRPTLRGLLAGLGCAVSDLGILPDRLEVIRDTLAAAAESHDLLVTSGGVSVGDEDHVKAALGQLGRLHLWRLALKPGKPLALGQVERAGQGGGVPFLGLPGNPVAVMVAFLLLGRPLVARLAGAVLPPPRRYRLPAGFSLKKKPGRREFPRARLEDGPEGTRVQLFRTDSSGVLTSLTAADGLVDLSEDLAAIQPGDMVDFLPLRELLG